jgi:hypothetical protein
MKPAKVISEPIERRNRLAELGLDEEDLQQCVFRGQSAYADCTPNHPPIFKGMCAWGETTCAVREYLLPKGWRRLDDGNLPTTVNKNGTITIMVSTGDEDTGRIEGNPSTKSSKGPRTAEAIASNLVDTLFGDIRKIANQPDDRATFMLLFHRDEISDEVRSELSSPLKINEDDGRIDEWKERIILGAIPFSGGTRSLTDSGPQTPPVDVEIKRRSA